MNIVILYGSVRTERQGIKAVKFIEQKLKERGHEVSIADPKEYDLPLIDKMYKEYEKGEAPENLEKLSKLFMKADGYIVVSAEYNHIPPPALTNMIDYFMPEFFFKPSAIVTYSAGNFGGVRALPVLRTFLAEVGMSSIPSPFAISKVQEFSEDGTPADDSYNKRVKRFLDEFEWYAQALKTKREQRTPY